MNRNVIKGTAITATAIFIGLSVFQLLLALGLPIGRAAWGGGHQVLPTPLRIASLVAVFILFFASYLVLSRSRIITNFDMPGLSRYGVLVLAILFSVNTLTNLASQSELEKVIMTPVALTLSICCFVLFFYPR